MVPSLYYCPTSFLYLSCTISSLISTNFRTFIIFTRLGLPYTSLYLLTLRPYSDILGRPPAKFVLVIRKLWCP